MMHAMIFSSIRVASYNIHKGLSQFNRRLIVHELKERLRLLGADIVFLQEVLGDHEAHPQRFPHWPGRPQHEFLADSVWQDYAYGRNAVYDEGHHGNAILSRFPIVQWDNEDISAHNLESRGMLHCHISVPGWKQPLHAINVHLGLTEGGRRRQLDMIRSRILAEVPAGDPLILAGDFNDWRVRACRYLGANLGLRDAFQIHQGRPARSFPALIPLLHLDRIYVRDLQVEAAEVHSGRNWRRLSDHAALTATLQQR